MPLVAVNYTGEIKSTVDAYDSLPDAEKAGKFWNEMSNEDLKKVKKHIKTHYINHQNYTCFYCQQRIEVGHNLIWDIEHIIPKDQFPEFLLEPKNLCISCKECNQEKGTKNILKDKRIKSFPEKSTDYLIVHPHFDEYKNHIKILDDSLLFIPLDKKGRTTIETCGLLRFIYKFSNYGNITLERKKKADELLNALHLTSDPLVENVILAAIIDLAKDTQKISQKAALKIALP